MAVGTIGLLMNLEHATANLSELAYLQGVTLPTMSSMVNTLVERGLIERQTSNTDRRMIILRVTPEGRKVALRAKQQLSDFIATMFGSLNEKELDTLLEGLAILNRILPHGDLSART